MLRNIMNKLNKKKKGGFTLIELIIVIAIIAILAAIALPKFMSVRETANVKSDLSNAKNIQTIVATLLSEDKISSTSTPIEVKTGDTYGEEILKQLQDVPSIKAKGFTGNFTVSLSGDDIQVYAGSVTSANLVYPDGTGVYKSK